MRRFMLDRRIDGVRSRTPVGCPACRTPDPIVVLWPEDPEPAASCIDCGAARTGAAYVRFIRVDRGPR